MSSFDLTSDLKPNPDESAALALEPLRSSCSEGFPDLLRGLGVSLLVTTYQAGKLVIVREQDGRVNTHFRSFGEADGTSSGPLGRARGDWDIASGLGVPRRARGRCSASSGGYP